MWLKAKIALSIIFILSISLMLAGCGNTENDVRNLSENYKTNRDYESLVALLPHLNYTMTRSEVESLLGAPIYCPTPYRCYYPSNQSVIVSCQNTNVISKETCQSYALILVVTYKMLDEANISSQDTLAGFVLGPVGE